MSASSSATGSSNNQAVLLKTYGESLADKQQEVVEFIAKRILSNKETFFQLKFSGGDVTLNVRYERIKLSDEQRDAVVRNFSTDFPTSGSGAKAIKRCKTRWKIRNSRRYRICLFSEQMTCEKRGELASALAQRIAKVDRHFVVVYNKDLGFMTGSDPEKWQYRVITVAEREKMSVAELNKAAAAIEEKLDKLAVFGIACFNRKSLVPLNLTTDDSRQTVETQENACIFG